MSDNEVQWFSFPFIAPKGKGAKGVKAKGEIHRIDPSELPLRQVPPKHQDLFRLTPKQRRDRIVELLLIGVKQLMKSRGEL